jgi:hypothetical protein
MKKKLGSFFAKWEQSSNMSLSNLLAKIEAREKELAAAQLEVDLDAGRIDEGINSFESVAMSLQEDASLAIAKLEQAGIGGENIEVLKEDLQTAQMLNSQGKYEDSAPLLSSIIKRAAKLAPQSGGFGIGLEPILITLLFLGAIAYILFGRKPPKSDALVAGLKKLEKQNGIVAGGRGTVAVQKQDDMGHEEMAAQKEDVGHGAAQKEKQNNGVGGHASVADAARAEEKERE